MLAAALRPDSRQEAPPRGLAGRHMVRVWGPHVQGSPRSFLPLWGEGLTVTAEKAWSPGEGPEHGGAGGGGVGVLRDHFLFSLCLWSSVSLCLSVSPCVSLRLRLCLDHSPSLSVCASLSPPLSLSISASLYISVSGYLPVSLCLPLSDSPFAALEAQLQWTQPGRTLKAAEAPASEFLSA